MVRIRLSRFGAKNQPKYRIVSIVDQNKREGKFLEILGTYDPTRNPADLSLKKERYDYWLSVGAQPSETVISLVKKINKQK